MTKLTRILAKGTYAIMGAAFLAAGVSTLLVNTGLLPDGVRDVIVVQFGQNNSGFLHILQELGSLLVLVALMTLWCVWNYERSRAFHWMLAAYWAIMAVIHWFNVASPTVSVVGGLINTIPVAVFLTLGLMRVATERRAEGVPQVASSMAERSVEEQPARSVS
jgi:hypothetical protein